MLSALDTAPSQSARRSTHAVPSRASWVVSTTAGPHVTEMCLWILKNWGLSKEPRQHKLVKQTRRNVERMKEIIENGKKETMGIGV